MRARARHGSMLVEVCFAMAIASLLLVGYQGVVRQLTHLELLTAEKHALTSAAVALGRTIVDHPELVTRARDLEVELARIGGDSHGERVEVERQPSEAMEADMVVITVTRTHPVLGACAGRAVVMLDAQAH